jgi:hypothetical protein
MNRGCSGNAGSVREGLISSWLLLVDRHAQAKMDCEGKEHPPQIIDGAAVVYALKWGDPVKLLGGRRFAEAATSDVRASASHLMRAMF